MSSPQKEMVLRFMDMAFKENRIREAFETYVAEDYIQHNPMLGDGRESAIAFLEAMMKMVQLEYNECKHVIEEGDRVVIFTHVKSDIALPGAVIVDMFRLENGLIAEHWDTVQRVPEFRLNTREMM